MVEFANLGGMHSQDVTAAVDAVARNLVQGRKVIVVCTILAGATGTVARLHAYGAAEVLVLGALSGTGPPPEGATQVLLPTEPIRTIADELRLDQALIDTPPPDAVAAVNVFDPEGEALVLINGFAGWDGGYLGRETIGGRPRAFLALEDKTRSRDFWAGAGVAHAPEEVAPCTRDALQDSASRLDRGDGTVWSADATDGMNGGADRVFWVRSPVEATQAYDQLSRVSRRVRVMPFLDGVPCSIHGIVLPDGVAVLRPVELLVLRQPGQLRFRYAGISTGWDPPQQDREQMRDLARALGAHLQQAYAYRGAFGVDGVLTAEGFRPHELNPRFAGGIGTIGKGVPDLPLRWLHDLLLAGHALDVTAADVETLLLDAADAHRFGAAYANAAVGSAVDTEVVLVAGDAQQLAITPDPAQAVGQLERGPGAQGDLVRFTPDEIADGARLAGWAVAAFALADRLWDTGFGELQAAPEAIRRR